MAGLVLGLVLGAGPARAQAPRAGGDVDYVADLVARTFLRALFDGNAAELMPLVGERVSLDGELAAGAARRERLGAAAARARAVGRPRRVVIMSYAAARARFGEAPARLRPLGLEGTIVAFARLERGGLIVILKKVGGRWKVVGLSD